MILFELDSANINNIQGDSFNVRYLLNMIFKISFIHLTILYYTINYHSR